MAERPCFLPKKRPRHSGHSRQIQSFSLENSLMDLCIWLVRGAYWPVPHNDSSQPQAPPPPPIRLGLHPSPGCVNPGDPSKVAPFTQQLL